MKATWKAPPELAWALPRPVQLKAGGIAMWSMVVVFTLGSVGLGAYLSSLAKRQTEAVEGLKAAGVEADATVISVNKIRGNNQRSRVEYRFSYRGRDYTNSFTSESRRARSLESGNHIPVRFLPSNPRAAHAIGWERGPMSPWLAIAVACSLLIPAAAFAYRLRWERRLLEEGTPTSAMVVAHSRTQHGVVVQYEYALPSGGMKTARSGPMRRAPDIGDQICILYDPENPRRSTPYPMQFYRVEARL